MNVEKIQFAGEGGVTLPGVLWLPEGGPRAVLQIAHGMTEHMGRYGRLAQALTEQGVAVAGFDLRGHGENPGDPDCASFGEGGWEASLEDMHRFSLSLRQRFPEARHYMLGFSLGSFLLREYLNRYPEPLSGAVILGTGHQPDAVLSLMMAIVKGQIRQAGFDKTTPLVKKLTFESYNQKFRPNRTPSDWLCEDREQLDAYRADPLCRENISAGLFWQLLGAMKRTGGRHAYDHWNKDLPVLLLSGENDPVGDFGKGVCRVKRAMDRSGFTHVTMHLIPNARHDLFHEEKSGAAENARRILTDWLSR